MKCIDPGHTYGSHIFDSENKLDDQFLQFMKREGDNYPFNVGTSPGTNCQEVLRVLIDRVLYLDAQKSAPENDIILTGLRSALMGFEIRAARKHGLELPAFRTPIEQVPTCKNCGHIVCHRNEKTAASALS